MGADELARAMRGITPEETAIVPVSPPSPAVAPAPELLGRVVAGKYRIERVIGHGTTSVVYEARHLELGSRVALKVLAAAVHGVADEAMHDRFEFEAQVLASLRHPNVITIFELGATHDGFRYIAMELLEGKTLGALLRRERRLPARRAVAIALQVAEALAALHERGLIHRDVKPANLYVTRHDSGEERVMLMDFGLVRALGSEDQGVIPSDAPRRRLQTLQGVILGTGAYMSPELIRGETLDARSDVYALGVVCYRMLTGSLPFEDDDMPRLLARHLGEAVEPPSRRAPDAAISNRLERVVLAALAKPREERPSSAREFARALASARRARVSVQDHRLRQ